MAGVGLAGESAMSGSWLAARSSGDFEPVIASSGRHTRRNEDWQGGKTLRDRILGNGTGK